MQLTLDDFETYKVVLSVCVEHRTDIDTDGEKFFNDLLARYGGEPTPEKLKRWLENIVPDLYPYIDKPPEWIQNPQWPFHDGVPMQFIGQLEIPDPNAEVFHDTTVFYLFMPVGRWCDSDLRVVSQQY